MMYSIPLIAIFIASLWHLSHSHISEQHYIAQCGANVKLDRPPNSTVSTPSIIECATECEKEVLCTGFNFNRIESRCEIFTQFIDCLVGPLVAGNGWTLYVIPDPCMNGGIVDETSGVCRCVPSWTGDRCQRMARDCSEIYDYCPDYRGEFFAYHHIKPDDGPSFPVKCYMNWGGFTYMMERTHHNCNKVSFNQDWSAYKEGFGELTDFLCDFWIGLENIHRITTIPGRKYTLDTTVYFQSDTPDVFYQTYLTDFYIEDEANGYRSHSSGYNLPPTRPAGDAYYRSSDPTNSMIGRMFSTPDRDQDSSSMTHCAQDTQSGWWFSDCGLVNPTGVWALTDDGTRNTSVPSIWWGVDGHGDSAVISMNLKLVGEDL